MEGNPFNDKSYNINFDNCKDLEIDFYYPQWHIIIPQIVLNIKKYTDPYIDNQVEVAFNEGCLIFNNIILDTKESSDRETQGIKICKRLTRIIYNLNGTTIDNYISFKKVSDNKRFEVKLKLKTNKL